jgi:hypothetical protein
MPKSGVIDTQEIAAWLELKGEYVRKHSGIVVVLLLFLYYSNVYIIYSFGQCRS